MLHILCLYLKIKSFLVTSQIQLQFTFTIGSINALNLSFITGLLVFYYKCLTHGQKQTH